MSKPSGARPACADGENSIVSPGLRRAVFLDRDGTVIVDTLFSTDPARLEPMPGAVEALRRLQEAGFLLVIITNQSGVARGYFTEEDLDAFHRHMADWFAQRDVRLAGVYFCPHHPDGTTPALSCACDCRKPAPGMILRAARELNVDPAASWMVGDRDADVGAGRAAGCRTIRVAGSSEGNGLAADFDAPDLAAAADRILSSAHGRAPG